MFRMLQWWKNLLLIVGWLLHSPRSLQGCHGCFLVTKVIHPHSCASMWDTWMQPCTSASHFCYLKMLCVYKRAKRGDTWPLMRLEGCKKERSIKHFIYRASFRPHLCLTSRGESTCHQNNSWFNYLETIFTKSQVISANFLKYRSINLKIGKTIRIWFFTT